MSRVIITDPFPRPLDAPAPDTIVIAPHSRVCRRISTQSLQSSAKDILRRNGFGIATPVRASGSLRQAVFAEGFVNDASSVAGHHREIIGSMLRSGVDLKRLAEFGSGRAQLAARIASRYVDSLIRDRLVDSDAALWMAIENGLIKKTKIVVYGYFRARQLDARPEEIEFIDRLADDGSIWYLPSGDEPIFRANRQWIELLQSRGWVARETGSDADLNEFEGLAGRFASGGDDHVSCRSANIDAFEYSDLEHEVRGTLARAKAAAIGGVPLSEIAIVCRDIQLYAPSIIAVAREYDLPVDIDCEVPLRETAFGEFVSLLFDVLELRSGHEIAVHTTANRRGFQYEPTLRLLLHRFGPGLSDDKRAEAYRTRPSTFDGWNDVCDATFDLYAGGERTEQEWILWLRRLFVKWHLLTAEKIGSSAADVTAFEKFFAAFDEHSRERGSFLITIADFAADVSDVLGHITTPLHAAHGGIKIMLPNVVVGGRFPLVFVVGMAEGMLPAPAVDSNVIDYCERESLRTHSIHFENALEVPRWEALTFYFTLLAASDTIVFSFPRFAADREQIPSAYFKRMGIEPVRSVSRFVSSRQEYRRAFLNTGGDETDDGVFAGAVHQLAVEQRRESDAPPDIYDGVIGVPVMRQTWSASSLARIGSCPFKWFANDVLMLRLPNESDTELRANIRGTLLHKTLELAVRRSLESADLRSAMAELLEDAFAEAEALHKPLTLVANWRLRRSEEIEKLRRAIAADEFIDDGAAVVDLEREFKAELCGLTVKGTIDRIDRLADGSLLAVDYKHGSSVARIKDESGYLRLEIQLPVYAGLALPKMFPDDRCSGGRFLHLAEPKHTRSKEVDLEAILTTIKRIVDEGRFAVDPDVKGEACTYCEYDVVCRVGPRLALKTDR